jgi:hypothetical protein
MSEGGWTLLHYFDPHLGYEFRGKTWCVDTRDIVDRPCSDILRLVLGKCRMIEGWMDLSTLFYTREGHN